MFNVLGIVQLLVLIVFLVVSYKKYGVIIFGDLMKLMFILWITNIGLYNLQLSKLYNPTWQINLIAMLIALIFFVASMKVSLNIKDIKDSFYNIVKDKDNYKIYSIITTIIFVISTIVFLININKYGLAILGENKIGKQQFDHYAGYIIYLLTLVAQIKYILFRAYNKKSEFLFFVVSLALLVLTLNRGPLMFIVVTIYIYEIFNLVNNKDKLSKKTIYIIYSLFIIGALVAITLFGYIGDMRMEYVLENVYKRTINEHYQMSSFIPSGFLWSYMYLTSPLENASFSIINQGYDFTFFNNLFYPFIKFFANLMGKGTEYKEWLTSRGGFEPYLEKKVGLNVSSFIPEAMQDMGYVGVVIYILIFLALAYFAISLIKRRKINFSTVGSIVIYSNVLSILGWSVFVNSLKMPMLIINILAIICIEVAKGLGIFDFILRKLKRG